MALAPTATLGGTSTATGTNKPNQTILLRSGVKDTDPAGSLKCVWTCVSKPSGANVDISETAPRNVDLTNAAAVDTDGDYTFKVTVTDAAGATKSAEVKIHVPQIQNKLSVSLSSGAGWVYDNAASEFTTASFSAVALDQFGNPMATQPTSFTYSIVSGGGSISGDTYTGPSSGAGTAVISVTDGTSSGRISEVYGYVVGQVYYDSEESLAGWEVQRLALDPSDDSVIGVIDSTYTNADGYFAFPKYTGTDTAVEVLSYAPSAVASDWDTSADMAFSYEGQPQSFSDDVVIPTSVATYIPTAVQIIPADAGVTYSDDAAAENDVATVGTGQEEAFTAVEVDQYGDPLATQPTFTWTSPGTVNSSTGVFTADGSVGTSGVTATDSSTGLSSTMDIDEVAPVVSQPASAVTANSDSIALSVLGSDPSDNIDPPSSSLTYTWSVTSKPSGASTSFSDNGDDAANSIVCSVSTTGTYDFSVVVSNGTTSVTDTASLDLTSDPSWLDSGSAASWDSGTHTLTVNGLATITADPGTDEPNIVADGPNAQVVIDPATPNSVVHIGGLTLTNGAGLTMVSVGDDSSSANHNILAVGTTGASSDPTFSIDCLSFLNMEDNDLVVHTGSSDTTGADLSAIESLVTTGSDSNAWDGNGVTSSAAAGKDYTDGTDDTGLNAEGNSTLGLSSWTIGSGSETLQTNDVVVQYQVAAPTVLTPASNNGYDGTSSSVSLSALGADGGGEPNLTYTWVAASVPAGVAAPTYSDNADNSAQNTTATLYGSGAYTFEVTITNKYGESVTSDVDVDASL